jgi:hypothetical protein
MRDPHLAPFRWPLAAFSLMLGLTAASAAVLFARKIGFSPESVRAFYLGSEAAFSRPRSMDGLLEVAVPHLLAVPLTLLVTVHLVGFAALLRPRPFALLAGAAFGSALAGIAAGFTIRFLWPGLAWLKIAAFAGFEATLLAWLALVVALFRGPRRAAGAAEPGAAGDPGRPAVAGGAPDGGAGLAAAASAAVPVRGRAAARRAASPGRARPPPGSPR